MFLLHNLLHFTRLLHAAGLDVHPGRTVEIATALEQVDFGHRADVYHTLRALLVHRQQDIAPFDAAFRLFWRAPAAERIPHDLRPMGERRRSGSPRIEATLEEAAAADSSPAVDETVERVAAMSYSGREVARTKDFAQLTEDELRHAEATIAAMRWTIDARRTRRWTPGRPGAIDLRLAARRNLRFGGEPLVLPTRVRSRKRRPLVVLCDMSGSMERYARLLLQFVHGVSGELHRTEVFVFATRLTRVTREVSRHRRRAATADVPWAPSDWGGGTRIGEALRAFNVRWAGRVLAHGAVVLLISDGWDRGDPDLLRQEMARLRRRCHRLIWLNPLLGAPDYQPLTRGMQAALPLVDDFLPAHNLASLESLAKHLEQLPPRRGVRPAKPRVSSAR